MTEIQSMLWKASLLVTTSTYFPRLVEAAAWREKKQYTDELLRRVASDPAVLDLLTLSADEGADAELVRHVSDLEDAAALDAQIIAVVVGFVPESNEERAMREMHTLNLQYLSTNGINPGDAWRQPLGGHDAYPKGWVVDHNGKSWISLVASNVWEPGVSGWREQVEDPGGPPEWLPPTGAHDAYNIGDQVTFQGAVYESLINANTWSPAAYPAGWKLVGA